MTSPAEASDYTNPWTHDGKIFRSEDIGDSYGFVYIITDTVSGKKYVGKKLFWSKKTRQVKGKKKRTVVESDWMTYYGSSLELIAQVSVRGEEYFKREMLHLCKSKGECNYLEAYEQFTRKVLLSDDYYNSWIMVKVHASHVKRLAMENQNGEISIKSDEEGDASGLYGGPVQADGEPAEGDRPKEKGRTRRAQPK